MTVHLAVYDGDNWFTACGFRAPSMSGHIDEVTCGACNRSRIVKLAAQGIDNRLDMTKAYRRGVPGLPDSA